jgi:hypothetical protein
MEAVTLETNLYYYYHASSMNGRLIF